jgi:hypothetical protein
MTVLVDEHLLVKAVDAKLADLKRRRSDFEARVAPLAAADANAEEEHRKAVDAALLEGAPMPPPVVRRIPEGTDVNARHSFMQEERQLTEERREAVAAAYPDVLKEARSKAIKLAKAARPTIVKLADEMGEIAERIGAVQACRDAANANPDGRRYFHDSRLTVETFIRLVVTGGDPISEVLDLTGGPQERLRSGRAGMTAGDIAQLIEGTYVPQQPVPSQSDPWKPSQPTETPATYRHPFGRPTTRP